MEPYINNTVLWKKGSSQILTAGILRITRDQRFSILHDCKYIYLFFSYVNIIFFI